MKKTKNPKKARKGKKPGAKRGRKPAAKAGRKPKASTADKKRIKRLTAKLKKATRTAKAVVKLANSIQKDLAFVMSK